MPTFSIIVTYRDTVTGLSWSITNHRAEANATAAFAALDGWNNTYMGIVPPTVEVVNGRISDVAKYRDMYLYQKAVFTNQVGTGAANSTEIGSYAMGRAAGDPNVGQGISYFKFHGISAALVTGSIFNTAGAGVAAFTAACSTFFQQYRPAATPNLPVVDPPVAFNSFQMQTHMYFRKLGRPLTFPGQQHAYLRT